jgi:FMN-dependent NADH-azoreductase
MTRLLHLDASILGGNSVSRQLSAAIVARLRQTAPQLETTYRDLGAAPLPHLSGAHFAAAQGAAPETAALAEDIAAGQAALEEFLAADIVVIGAPMYNFTLSTQLKAWLDRILIAGKTFAYGPNGAEGLAGGRRVIVLAGKTFSYSEKGVQGLAGGKRVIIAVSRGGFYGADTPAAAGEHLETYLRWVFGFIGITDLEIILAEGVQRGPELREKALTEALAAATGLKAA